MQYDPIRHCYIDPENGAIIPFQEGDDLGGIELFDMNAAQSSVPRRDEEAYPKSNITETLVKLGRKGRELPGSATPKKGIFSNLFSSPSNMSAVPTTEIGVSDQEQLDDDWSIARAIQSMELELESYWYRQEGGDFNEKEVMASDFKRQIFTLSFFICLLQVAILIVMIQDDGYASQSANPTYGPPPTTLVRYGGKDAALILYKHEWWRLLSPIMLHAGIIHILCNVLIQFRVGGYLNLMYGNARWLIIYLVSGIFGNMFSCCVLTAYIGVGSSGAVLGLLSSWIVWLGFRWQKIPESNHKTRNFQLAIVVVSVVATLAMSFTSLVDWGAHFGGALQGILWGMILLSHEIDNLHTRYIVRVVAGAVSLACFAAALVYMLVYMDPSKDNMSLFEKNDDWNHFPHGGEVS